jgi:hypothetical protein
MHGTFVKVLMDPVSRKMFVPTFGEITKIVIYYLLITEIGHHFYCGAIHGI